MRILTVCGLGQGTSLILRMNVESVLKNIGVTAEVENSDVSTALCEKADLIITNKELAENLANSPIPILIVKNYFDKDEIQNALVSYFKKSE
ncbi:PTS sugar transporter subunit IIB [Thermoanaerobacter pentosaceus]|uniref:PTS system ascorbate-specific IIB component n=1 Tax=Thermoanaerobacter pentosaceus TaxID=694059 RepID=A0ABT9M7G7_9THEO|nr:PTS sugar transporter subunit IIB [Thermoanaerobacter pentosaceus]MDP9752081.1 PTS system ascorbate-specific IIB component [Thermoanaerobacter pentosaceus]